MEPVPNRQLLLVDDEPALIELFQRIAQKKSYGLLLARDGGEALEILTKHPVDVALLDLNLKGLSGLQVLEHLKKTQVDTEAIVITGRATVESAIAALKMGAYDYITKPFDDVDQLCLRIEKAMEKVALVRRLHKLEQGHVASGDFLDFVGKSQKMREVYALIGHVASGLSNVLILGESGTGKELVAAAIHQKSERRDGPFTVINCAAVPETLLESELFGYVKGAFTGAVGDKTGLFEQAQGGTIFLDEIGDISAAMQVKLLRVLQDGEIRRVGGNRVYYSNARVIAATNQDLAQLVKKKLFREDLFYRLNVISIQVPPLRERAEDIPLLAYHFLREFAERLRRPVQKISVDAMQSLQAYRWPGNVRELENAMERAVVLTHGDTVTAKDLPANLLGAVFYLPDDHEQQELNHLPYQEAKERAVNNFNKNYVLYLLKQAGGNLSTASLKAGMDRSNFKKIVKKCAVNVKEIKKGLMG